MSYEIISLNTRIYYNNLEKEYYNIITLNKISAGPLKNYTRTININTSSDKINNNINDFCSLAIDSSIINNNKKKTLNICTIDDLDSIYEFLLNNNYTIDNLLNNINMNTCKNIKVNNKNILFYIKYKID
tara:strand:+ start:1419 stop:1808 length:390 start_codon:yes stop_codon:yes gene_type:complete